MIGDRTLVIAAMLTLATGTFAFRFVGPLLHRRIAFSPRARQTLETSAIVLLAGLVALSSLTQGHGLAGFARPAGVVAGGLLAWRKAPLLAVVIASATTTALLRLG
jgi:branched-subunit amino acid transport protein